MYNIVQRKHVHIIFRAVSGVFHFPAEVTIYKRMDGMCLNAADKKLCIYRAYFPGAIVLSPIHVYTLYSV